MWSLCIWQCRGGRHEHGVEESVQGGQRNRDDCAAQMHAIACAEPGGARGRWAVHTDVCSGVSCCPHTWHWHTEHVRTQSARHPFHGLGEVIWQQAEGRGSVEEGSDRWYTKCLDLCVQRRNSQAEKSEHGGTRWHGGTLELKNNFTIAPRPGDGKVVERFKTTTHRREACQTFLSVCESVTECVWASLCAVWLAGKLYNHNARLRCALNKMAGGILPPLKGDLPMTFKSRPSTYAINRAPTGRGRCRKCKHFILKGELPQTTQRAPPIYRVLRPPLGAAIGGVTARGRNTNPT